MELEDEERYHDEESMLNYYKHRKLGRYSKVPGSGNDEKGYFAFIRAVYNQRFYEEDVSLSPEGTLKIAVRCDAAAPKNMPTPTALHEEDEETGLCKFCGSSAPVYGTTNSHHASLSNATELRIPFHGRKGFICYLELADPATEETEVYENPNVTRTLHELFKLMLEWEWVYDNLDQNDVCAVLAHDILEEIDLPEMLRSWLWNNVPDMHVAKFLKGDPDARLRPPASTIPPMLPEFEGWCYHHIHETEPIWKYGSR
jgi:hypothetical protein